MPQHCSLSGRWKQHSLGLEGEGGDAKSKAMEMGSPSVCKGAGVVVGVPHGRDLQVEEGGRVALGGLVNVGS